MEKEDIDKLFDEGKTYRSWLREEPFKRKNHVCFDIPATREGTDWFNFEDKLMKAAMHGCTECLDKLIKAGANLKKKGKNKITALMWASRYGYPDCVNLLLAAGADLYKTDKFGNTALSHAVNRSKEFFWEGGQQRECLDILLKAIGSNVNRSPLATETPLISVAAFGENTWLKSLIEAGADINRTDIFGSTALVRTITAKHDDCTKTLLKAGADVNIVDKEKFTALKHAASVLNKDCITWLLEAGAEVKDDINCTYINVAVEYGVSYSFPPEELVQTYRCIQQLLKIGGYINQATDKNALEAYIAFIGITHGPIQMLLLAAGNTVNERSKAVIMNDYLSQEDQDEFSLKYRCREVVREQMITAHPHDNLFQAVHKLNIPAELESYLVYDVSLDDNDFSNAEFFLMWQTLQTDSEDEEDDEEDWDDDDYE